MNEKNAGIINKGMNAMMIADGAKQVNKSYNNVNNKYDNLMGTTVPKLGANKMGAGNKMIAERTASEQIDELLKQASIGSKVKGALGAVAKGAEKLDGINNASIQKSVKGFKNKNYKAGLKNGAKALAITAPAIAAAGGAGVGVTKGLDKLNDKFGKRDDRQGDGKLGKKLENKVIGAGLSTALVLNGLANKSAYKPLKQALKVSKHQTLKYPMKRIKDKFPGAKVVAKSMKDASKKFKGEVAMQERMAQNAINIKDRQVASHASKIYNIVNKSSSALNATDIKSSYMKVLRTDFNRLNASKGLSDSKIDELWNKSMPEMNKTVDEAIDRILNRNKKASSEIDFLFEKVAGNNFNYAKKVFKENFYKRG